MVWHVLMAVILAVYFEITGQYILYKLNRNTFPIAMGIGLMTMMSYCYITTSIISFKWGSATLTYGIYVIYILLSLVFVVKDIKKVNWHFDYKNWIIALIFVGVMLYYAWNTTLGDLDGFDSVYYLNLISTNTATNELNSISMYWGGRNGWISSRYTFQSYYYFASFVTYFYTRILNKITDANNLSVIIWSFQTLYNFFYVSVLINGIERIFKGKKLFKYVILFIFLFFFGKVYFNNVFGFYGNSYNLIAISYACMFLYDIFKDYDKEDWILYGISLYGACAFSSSSLFVMIFILFGTYFVLINKEDKLFKYYAFILLFPLINLLEVLLEKNILLMIAYSLVICGVLFFANNVLVKASRLKYTKIFIIVIGFISMFYLSFKVTGNIFDFSAFIDNNSETADMTINYFINYNNSGQNEVNYRFFVLLLLAYVLIFEYKNPLIMSYIILIIIIFNPFCCAYINKINSVYYRAYDFIINPFTITLFLSLLLNRFNNKYFYYICLGVTLVVFAINVDFINPSYYNESFEPEENYNNQMKMSNDAYDAISYVKKELDYNGKSSYIVTENLLTESIIPTSRYIYGRGLMTQTWSDAEFQVFSMFYPMDVYGNSTYEDVPADYDNMGKYIKESGIEYLIIDMNKEYYDKSTGEYGYLHYKVAECGVGFMCYSNDSYEVYYFGDVD